MAKSPEKTKAVGKFFLTASDLANKRGGNKKLQAIVGKSIYFSSSNGKNWFFSNDNVWKLTIKKLTELTNKIKEQIK